MVAPNKLDQRLNEAIAHHNAGRLDRAEAIYRQMAAGTHRQSTVLYLWGVLAEQQNRLEDAGRLYQQSLRVEPAAPAPTVRLSYLLIATGHAAEAEQLLRHVLNRAPKARELWTTLGHALKVRGRLADAIAAQQKAVEIDPKFADGWLQLGFSNGSVGKNQLALSHYARALALDPKLALARYGRAQSLHKTYRVAESLREYDAFLKAQPQHIEARSFRLYALQNAEDVSREQYFAEHVAYGNALPKGPATLPDYDLSPDKRLRVGILSPDFRTHSCAFFLEPLLQHLDRSQFELYLYHDHFLEDAVTARFRAMAAVWRNFVGQPNDAVEKAIRADKPDILIDLTGHIGSTIRLPVFAKRVAPVQITYLGYPDTTGTPNMDFRFTDAIADPVGDADAFATEKLVRFAPVAWCYRPSPDAPDVPPIACASGAPVTFGCFNSPTKFSHGLFVAWAQLLAQVPNSRLLLKGRDFDEPQVRDDMMARMKAAGIPLDRVDLLPRTLGIAEHLAAYARVDVALDTFGYTGTTTTCEALWMGRPVVTLCGTRHASRVSASLLTAVGRPGWIAHTPADYVRIARDLATDPPALCTASASLRSAMSQSPLLAAASQSAHFAAALRAGWRERAAPR
jgi:predicted O-linked N-acetylglucosamine transferase (SPINDLY family)